MNKESKKCEWCGGEFYYSDLFSEIKYYAVATWKKKKYCSLKCKRAAWKKSYFDNNPDYLKKWGKAEGNRKSKSKKCLQCGKEVNPIGMSKHQLGIWNQIRFCSKKCGQRFSYLKTNGSQKAKDYYHKGGGKERRKLYLNRPEISEKLDKYHKEYRIKNRDLILKKNKEKTIKKRKKVLLKYGNKCSCCGENTFEFLAIDHINNDGSKHRKQLGINSSTAMVNWIIENNYPPIFQIHCHNCNMARHIYKICPHKKNV